jgi:hypothetical protein
MSTLAERKAEWIQRAKGMLKEQGSHIQWLAINGFSLIRDTVDAAPGGQKADAFTNCLADLANQSGVGAAQVKEYMKVGFLADKIPSLFQRCKIMTAVQLARIVDVADNGLEFTVSADNLDRIKAWVLSDDDKRSKVDKLRAECGKGPKARQSGKNPPATPTATTPSAATLAIKVEDIPKYVASRLSGVSSDTLSEVCECLDSDTFGGLVEQAGKSATAPELLAFWRSFADQLNPESATDRKAYHAVLGVIGKSMHPADCLALVAGFFKRCQTTGESGMDDYSTFVEGVGTLHAEFKAALKHGKQQPVAA